MVIWNNFTNILFSHADDENVKHFPEVLHGSIRKVSYVLKRMQIQM